ncbi:fimbrial protein [Dyella sp. GSA-30]|uniref:fimbrial protein n=1 Tax=Dyella sp. GSA-30 TaxID=2994496 RepID=UPI002491D534|nr:fimbrial protein [Dyella sp. GSA-30]BDU19714.1 fimbrial protein [Dyella sp. GSA-30]
MNPVRHTIVLLFMALLSTLPIAARASCSFSSGNTSNVNISMPNSVVTINANAPVGTVLASSSQFAPSPTSELSCSGTTRIGVVNLVGSQPGTSTTIFPTGTSGVGYRITHPDTSNYLVPYGGDSVASGTYELSVTSGFELVKTGPIANGAVLNAGTLGYWRYDGFFGLLRAENFNLVGSVTFTYPSCTVNNNAINVVLPTISTTAFNGIGTTAGATAFNISLSCSAGSTLAIEFDTSNPASVANSVIANSTGSGRAKNVGVQLIDQSFVPITFGTPAVVGATPNGPYNLTYYARYYQTAASPAAGTVSTTATFTLSYQ